jgi:hypothetical protein
MEELIGEAVGADGHQNGSAKATPPTTNHDNVGLTLFEFAKARFRRDKTLTKPLSKLHLTFARGESAFTILTLGDRRGLVDPELIRIWFGEERLPDGWRGNVTGWQVGLGELNSVAGRVGQIVDHLKRDAQNH